MSGIIALAVLFGGISILAAAFLGVSVIEYRAARERELS